MMKKLSTGQGGGAEQETPVPGPGVTSGTVSAGGPLGSGGTHGQPGDVHGLPPDRLARGSSFRRTARQVRLPAVTQQWSLPACALPGSGTDVRCTGAGGNSWTVALRRATRAIATPSEQHPVAVVAEDSSFRENGLAASSRGKWIL
ncbi:hypothetical protein QAD02_022232 [Eretmocerus hayati]|uniref:Uncharacterized protein n=1 Tax=Eretmocerus hayati TaxID=131215 RepID=A0ACC2PSH1_9HYME|nr:hypothetical protein QAD02_022232 [Eretmocerus hayati]